jgi:hypothetical protein
MLRDVYHVPTDRVNVVSASQCQRDGAYYYDAGRRELRTQQTGLVAATVEELGSGDGSRYLLHTARDKKDEDNEVAEAALAVAECGCSLM